ncbi:MAG: redox-regulated ATPase YchF, partial [Thermoanaerobaculia bacterium]
PMLRAGIVGLPNVGKSTLFNALTRTRKAQVANYPFCTIEPNVGIVTVPDPRLAPLAKIATTSDGLPAAFGLVDIAGLVKGASKGEGLGNKFLAYVREVDAIVHVVRCFENKDIVHISDRLDPVADIETITAELVLADLESLTKQRDGLEKLARGGNKEGIARMAVAGKLLLHLDSGKPAQELDLSPAERTAARELFLMTMKPTLFACNVAEGDLERADELLLVKKVRDLSAHQGSETVAISARIEAELAGLPEADAKEYLASHGLGEPRAGTLIRAAYHLAATAFSPGEL